MVDVGEKATTARLAQAEGYLYANAQVIEGAAAHSLQKGDVITVAKVAGIQAAKRCADLIPLCHTLPLSKIDIQIELQPDQGRFQVRCECRTSGQTGVEMEALTGATVSLLTLYDMCKAVDKHMRIDHVEVVKKAGGKSGSWEKS